MRADDPELAARPGTVWDRPEPAPRAAPRPLSRAAIVAAAVTTADHQGLLAVTLRHVAAALDVGPMRLYRYVASKEELLELMVDSVYGEIVAVDPALQEWRAVVRSIAYRTRRAAADHPWFVEFLGGRPHVGPNGLAYLESFLAALERGLPGADSGTVLSVASTLNAYVIGALRSEAGDRGTERESGASTREWQYALWPYLQEMIAKNQLPTFAKIISSAPDVSPDAQFAEGLERVLDGTVSRLANRGGAPDGP